jgi:triosephosphate isomerase
MKKQFIVGNWKSNKTIDETQEWLNEFMVHSSQFTEEKVVILCPPFPLLSLIQDFIKQHHLPIALGTQDISPFGDGAYTGEVDGHLLKDFVQYAIIGHSERRKYFSETDELLGQKVAMAKAYGIEPIYCISEKNMPIPSGVNIVAFEPLAAIGSGHPDSPENAEEVARFLKEKNSVSYVLYGGSVTAANVRDFTQQVSIDGVLPGGASLSPREFASLIYHA